MEPGFILNDSRNNSKIDDIQTGNKKIALTIKVTGRIASLDLSKLAAGHVLESDSEVLALCVFTTGTQ